jgi:asparaginyl-tRNA synthetase
MMPKRTKIATLLQQGNSGFDTTVMGWIRSFRNNQFIALNDGSTNQTLQVVVDPETTDPALLRRLSVGAAIRATGAIIPSQGKGQQIEMTASQIEVYGDCDASAYPIQPKKHSLEFLREHAHLRFRTNTFGSVFRIRHLAAYAIHRFFHERGFVYLHSPIITGSDAEGAGEMFRVSTIDPAHPPRTESGDVDYRSDFFGKSTNLTVSG